MSKVKLTGEQLSICLGALPDEMIAEALSSNSPRKPVRVGALFSIAACLCIVIALCVPQLNQFGILPSEESGSQLLNNVYPIVCCVRPEEAGEASSLYVNTVYNKTVSEEIKRKFPGLDTETAIYIFHLSDRKESIYWFPVYAKGEVINIVFASLLEDGRVVVGMTASNADELNAIAQFTSETAPASIVTDGKEVYYIINGKAYVFSEDLDMPAYLNSFHCPDAELIVKEIKPK